MYIMANNLEFDSLGNNNSEDKKKFTKKTGILNTF